MKEEGLGSAAIWHLSSPSHICCTTRVAHAVSHCVLVIIFSVLSLSEDTGETEHKVFKQGHIKFSNWFLAYYKDIQPVKELGRDKNSDL